MFETFIVLILTVAFPVACLTKIILVKSEQKHQRKSQGDPRTFEIIDSLANTVSKLQSRVENLETIIQRRYE